MSLTLFSSLIIVWIAAIVSPGPDVVQVTRLGLHSRRAGMWAGAGVVTGITLWTVASMLGLSALVAARPGILGVLQVIGGSYLLWMGVQALRPPGEEEAESGETSASISSDVAAWRLGAATNLANPKALLFFGAVFAQFIHPGMGWGWKLLIAVVLNLIALAWFLLLAATVHSVAAVLVRNARIVDVVAGVVFIGLGLWMLGAGAGALGWGLD